MVTVSVIDLQSINQTTCITEAIFAFSRSLRELDVWMNELHEWTSETWKAAENACVGARIHTLLSWVPEPRRHTLPVTWRPEFGSQLVFEGFGTTLLFKRRIHRHIYQSVNYLIVVLTVHISYLLSFVTVAELFRGELFSGMLFSTSLHFQVWLSFPVTTLTIILHLIIKLY